MNKIAKTYWGKSLDQSVFNKIMTLSNRHPYYVNYLCDILWTVNKTLPNEQQVVEAWHGVIDEEWGDAVRELASLPLNQRKILKLLGHQRIDSLFSKDMVLKLNMPASTISSNINSLLKRDYIEKNQAGYYQIVSPLLLAVTNLQQIE